MSKSNPTILITGGTGFAGSHLVEALLKKGAKNIHVTSYGTRDSLVKQLLAPQHIHSLDLTNKNKTEKLFENLHPDQIYHLAAYAAVGDSFDKTSQVLENNLKLQLNVLESVKKYTPQARVLVVGSSMEYDFLRKSTSKISESHPLGPVSPYAVSKVLQDLLALSYQRSYQLDIIRVRPFNHIGERQSPDFVVSSFAKQIVAIERKESSGLKVGNLKAIRDFSDVRDVVLAYLLLMEKGESGEVYNIGSERGYPIEEILGMLIKVSSAQVKITKDKRRLRPSDVPSVVADVTKIKKLGWRPTSDIEPTIKRVLDYWRKRS